MKIFVIFLILIGFVGFTHAQDLDSVIDIPVCSPGTELVDGLCRVIKTDREHSGPMPKFIDALFFMLIVLPFFIPGAIIFVVISKTPRFSREIRLTVCIPAIIMILYFLSGLYLGWYPPAYA
jgi:hypothetical protein